MFLQICHIVIYTQHLFAFTPLFQQTSKNRDELNSIPHDDIAFSPNYTLDIVCRYWRTFWSCLRPYQTRIEESKHQSDDQHIQFW